MKKDEFISIAMERAHNDFIAGKQLPVDGYLSFKLNEQGEVISSIIDGRRFDMSSDDYKSAAGFHELRFEFNYRMELYDSALYHLKRVIGIKLNSIEKKYCL